MRENLQAARKGKKLTQQAMAELLGIDIRYYKAIEYGERLGGVDLWDKMEDITGTHQRILRETSKNHPAQEDSQ